MRSGKVIDFTSQWTAIVRKEGDAWRIVRIQATIDPIRNPIIATVQGYAKWLIAGGMLLLGLIIGRLLPRRKAA